MEKHIEYVWYSPELDLIAVDETRDAYLFEDDFGKFHLIYAINLDFRLIKFYLIGEF